MRSEQPASAEQSTPHNEIASSAWTPTSAHANAALNGDVCTCGKKTIQAASHHRVDCPYRLLTEAAQMLTGCTPQAFGGGASRTAPSAARHAIFSKPLVDTEAIIDATLKKHYGTLFTEQDVRFARDLRDQLRAAQGIAGGQPHALHCASSVRPSDAEIEQKWNEADDVCARLTTNRKPAWKHFAESLLKGPANAEPVRARSDNPDDAGAIAAPSAAPHTMWTYCTPRDNDSPKFLIVFDDADQPPIMLTDDAAARTAFDRYEQNWNCHLFELAKRAQAQGQREANERPFAWPPLSAGAHHAVVDLLKHGVTRTWGPWDIYDAIKANTPEHQASPLDPGSWGLMNEGPRWVLEQARCALTGPIADGTGRRAALAAIDAALDLPAPVFGVPGEWLRGMIAYLEDSVEKIGPNESQGSIEARKLLYRAPPPAVDGKSQAAFVAHAMIRWLRENKAALGTHDQVAIDAALRRFLGTPARAGQVHLSGSMSSAPPPGAAPIGESPSNGKTHDR